MDINSTKNNKADGGIYSNKIGAIIVMTSNIKESSGSRAVPQRAVEMANRAQYLQRQVRWATNKGVAQSPNPKQIMYD